MSIALIDGDCIIYEVGFASDAGARANGEPHEPLSFCLNGVKEKIKSIKEITRATDTIVFVSNNEVPGYRVESYPEYKINRDPAHRPYWYKELREYMLEKQDAVLSEPGDEADDALGIAQTFYNAYGTDTILCTKDKDLDMIPGWHYNWSKKRRDDGVYFVDTTTANRIFYKQLLTGDSTDNIPGMFKLLGKKATSKWLSPIDDMDDEEEMYEYVCSIYKDRELVETLSTLIWIKRHERARAF